VVKRFWQLLLLFPVCLFATNGAADIGVGAKSKGMGGVGIALPQDAFASAMNPAGLIQVGCRLDLGVGYTRQESFQRHYNISNNQTIELFTGSNKRRGLWWPEGALSWRYCSNQSVGLAIFVRGALATKVNYLWFPYSGNVAPSGFSAYTLFIVPSWSISFSPCLSVGVGLGGIVQWSDNNVDIAGVDSSVAPNASDGRFIGPGTAGGAGGVNVRGGILFSPRNGFHLGVTYQTPALMGKIKKYGGQWPDGGRWDWPAEMGAGASYIFSDTLDCIMVSIDWVYRFWNRTATWGNSYVTAEAEAGGLRYLTGTELGPGFGWRNQTVWKFGASWNPCEIDCLTVRFGYNFCTNPIVGDEILLNRMTIANMQHHITVGATLAICRVDLTFYYYHGFENVTKGRGPLLINANTTADISIKQNAIGIQVGGRW